jgi:hypothetical protein
MVRLAIKIWKNECRFTAVEYGIMSALAVIYAEQIAMKL